MTDGQPGHALNRAEVRANSRFNSCDGGLLLELEAFLDDQADADDGQPNDAMCLLTQVRTALRSSHSLRNALCTILEWYEQLPNDELPPQPVRNAFGKINRALGVPEK